MRVLAEMGQKETEKKNKLKQTVLRSPDKNLIFVRVNAEIEKKKSFILMVGYKKWLVGNVEAIETSESCKGGSFVCNGGNLY